MAFYTCCNATGTFVSNVWTQLFSVAFLPLLLKLFSFEITSLRLLFTISFKSEGQITLQFPESPPPAPKMFDDCLFHLLRTRQQVRLIMQKIAFSWYGRLVEWIDLVDDGVGGAILKQVNQWQIWMVQNIMWQKNSQYFLAQSRGRDITQTVRELMN